MCAVLIGVWMLNNEFVADTFEAFDVEPSQGWNYWWWRESWPAIAVSAPCAGAAIYCLAKGVAAIKWRA